MYSSQVCAQIPAHASKLHVGAPFLGVEGGREL